MRAHLLEQIARLDSQIIALEGERLPAMSAKVSILSFLKVKRSALAEKLRRYPPYAELGLSRSSTS